MNKYVKKNIVPVIIFGLGIILIIMIYFEYCSKAFDLGLKEIKFQEGVRLVEKTTKILSKMNLKKMTNQEIEEVKEL